MRDIFILENMAACQSLINDHVIKGYNDDCYLGVGSFASSFLNTEHKGVDVKVTPSFLQQDLIDYIVQGHISIYEQESILIQSYLKNGVANITKWLLLGQHSTIFSLPKSEINKYVKQASILTLEDLISVYFNSLISKINELRAQIVIILLDIEMFKNYAVEYMKWAKKTNNSNIFVEELSSLNLLENSIIKELLYFLSNAFFSNKIVIVPSSEKYFVPFLNTIHEIKRDLNLYSKDVIFRI